MVAKSETIRRFSRQWASLYTQRMILLQDYWPIQLFHFQPMRAQYRMENSQRHTS